MHDAQQAAFLVNPHHHKRVQGQKPKTTVGAKQRVVIPKERNCEVCKLHEQCHTPKMEPFGEGKLGITIVGESPGRDEDRLGRPFIGRSGQLLKSSLELAGIVLDRDCFITNAFQCRPPDNKEPKLMKVWAECCAPRLEKQLLGFKPSLIITMGMDALRAVLHPPAGLGLSATLARGLAFPSLKYGCWVGCCWHPSFVMRDEEEKRFIFDKDILLAISHLGQPLNPPLTEEGNVVVTKLELAREMFRNFKGQRVRVDYETNAIDPFIKEPKIWCASFAVDKEHGYWLPLEYGSYWTAAEKDKIYQLLKDLLSDKGTVKVIQNLRMEQLWSQIVLGTTIENVDNDTMITSHVIDERRGFQSVSSAGFVSEGRGISSLEFQVYQLTGHEYKDMVDVENIGAAPVEKLVPYSCWDSRYTAWIDDVQQAVWSAEPATKMAKEFFCTRVQALINASRRGMALDLPLLESQVTDTQAKLEKARDAILTSEWAQKFEQVSGKPMTIAKTVSDTDLRTLLYTVHGLPHPPWKTDKNKLPTDKEALDWIVDKAQDESFTEFRKQLGLYSANATLLNTFLLGFKNALHPDGLMHPSFSLHTVETFRSSSHDPNFQNLPKRSEEHQEFRKLIIPHLGQKFIEADAAASEVRVIAMITQDPVLVKQVQEGFDPHSYWASRMYDVAVDKVTKEMRFMGKNKLVFPLYYGSYYKTIAADFKLPEQHVQRVEQEFWSMYKNVKKWQEESIAFYYRNGYIEMPLGFRRHGPLSKNQVLNSSIQGASFHLLLEAFYRADCDMLAKGMRSGLCAEVHDSILCDTAEEETEDAVVILYQRMTEKQFDWQHSVPRGVDLAIGPNWGEMKPFVL